MRLWNRFRYWFVRSRLERDLAEEMRLHRETLEDQFVRDGMSRNEARLQAARQFGNSTVAIEESREEWSFIWLDNIFKDLYFAWRLMIRQPLLTAAAALTVAFGVGANTAIVSVLETALLNPLGLRQADKVMVARIRLDNIQMRRAPVSGVELREIQSMTETFSAVAAMEGRSWTSQSDSGPSRLVGRAVTADFFRVFGEQPILGRFFTPEDREFESVVLSYSVWQSQFSGDRSVIGKVVMLDDKPHRVIGVAPAAFRFPAEAQAWEPLTLAPDRFQRRFMNMTLALFARRKDGVTPAQAVDRINRHVAALKSPETAEGRGLTRSTYSIELDPLAQYVAGDLRRPLLLLWAAALVVLCMGCANVAGLLLTRTAGRRREIAIRLSVGATPLRIVRQLLLESLLLGLLGGVAGLLVARFALSLLNRLVIPGKQLLELAALDRRMLLYGLALALLSGLLFGLVPALQLLRESQSSELARSRRRWFQDLFVTAEVASAFLLVVLSALLLRSLLAVQRLQPGFDPEHVTTAFLLKPKNDPGFLDRLQNELRSSPGIQSAALVNPVPFASSGTGSTPGSGSLTSGFSIKNRKKQPGEPEWHGEAFQVSPDYFQTLRIPLLRGRNLADSDAAGSPLVCLIDSRLAQRFFPGADPVGQELGMYRGWARIVGVVGAIRDTTLEDNSRPAVYYTLAQVPYFPQVAIVARSNASAGSSVRQAVRRANASVPLFDMRSMEERIGESLGIRRVLVALLSVFGAISLLLAAVGLYGVIAQIVAERTHEIGIRMALGAHQGQILAQFLRQGLYSGFLGLIFGMAAAAYAQRWLAGMLYQVKPYDIEIFGFASLGILAMLVAAVWWPALRASRVDPQEALRPGD